MLYEFGSGDKEELGSEIRKWRKRVDTVSKLRTEESNQLGIPFFCFFSCLLFSILLYFFGSRPSTNGVGTGFDHLRITAKWRWSFPVRRIRRKVTRSGTDRLWHLWVRTITYAAGLFNASFSFIFPFLLYGICSPGGRRLKRGIMERRHVTRGRVTAISYSRLARSLRSLAITLPIHQHLMSLASTFATVFL